MFLGDSMPHILGLVLTLLLPAYVLGEPLGHKLAMAAIERTTHDVRYDGSYRSIGYPGGDVPDEMGVCTDVVIRSYRALGIDLQRLLHEDIRDNFAAYPSRRVWGLSGPDPNIDHRRVLNLQVFLERNAMSLAPSADASHYHAGDTVTWMLPGNIPHIGIVTGEQYQGSGNPMVVHNIGE